MKTKIMIIDDEKHCIDTLFHHLSKIESVEIVATTQDSTTVKKLLDLHKPDLMLIDIEMPKLSGFEVLEQLEEINFKIVFTTAYDQYAIKALKLNAFDYLLKPISKKDIVELLQKYNDNQILSSKEQINNIQKFNNTKLQDTIAVSSNEGLHFLKIEDIMYFEATNCYTNIMMNNGSKFLISKTMGNFEDILQDNSLFFRVHKSFIVNLRYIKQYIRGEGGEIIMQDNTYITISRRRKQDFLDLFIKV
jgi:two-component system, LytTR family, response regulator